MGSGLGQRSGGSPIANFTSDSGYSDEIGHNFCAEFNSPPNFRFKSESSFTLSPLDVDVAHLVAGEKGVVLEHDLVRVPAERSSVNSISGRSKQHFRPRANFFKHFSGD